MFPKGFFYTIIENIDYLGKGLTLYQETKI